MYRDCTIQQKQKNIEDTDEIYLGLVGRIQQSTIGENLYYTLY